MSVETSEVHSKSRKERERETERESEKEGERDGGRARARQGVDRASEKLPFSIGA